MHYVKEVNPRLTGYDRGNNVLNGIAAIPDEYGSFYVTGKMWSFVFKVKFTSIANAPSDSGASSYLQKDDSL